MSQGMVMGIMLATTLIVAGPAEAQGRRSSSSGNPYGGSQFFGGDAARGGPFARGVARVEGPVGGPGTGVRRPGGAGFRYGYGGFGRRGFRHGSGFIAPGFGYCPFPVGGIGFSPVVFQYGAFQYGANPFLPASAFGYGPTRLVSPPGVPAFRGAHVNLPQINLPQANLPRVAFPNADAPLNVARPIDLAAAMGRVGRDDAAELRRRVAALKTSSPQDRDRADGLIEEADGFFAEGRLGRAAAKYRKAIASAPDYAEAHFRLAHAQVAIEQYNSAKRSVFTALRLSASADRGSFSLAELYRGNRLARERHLADLVAAAAREPADGGLPFLIGFTQHFGGQPLQARDAFRAAAEREGLQREFVPYFLPVVDVDEP